MSFPTTKKQLWALYKETVPESERQLTWKSKVTEFKETLRDLFPTDSLAIKTDILTAIKNDVTYNNRSFLWRLWTKYEFCAHRLSYKSPNIKDDLQKWVKSHYPEVTWPETVYTYDNKNQLTKPEIEWQEEMYQDILRGFQILTVPDEKREFNIEKDRKCDDPDNKKGKCFPVVDEDHTARYCRCCGYIFSETFMFTTMEDHKASVKMRSEKYIRNKYIEERMHLMNNYVRERGKWKYNENYQPKFFESMIARLGPRPTWKEVRELYGKCGLKSGHWTSFYAAYKEWGLSWSAEEMDLIYKADALFTLPIAYTMVKVKELKLNGPEHDDAWKVPIATSKRQLRIYDKTWKRVCGLLSIRYIGPTPQYQLLL